MSGQNRELAKKRLKEQKRKQKDRKKERSRRAKRSAKGKRIHWEKLDNTANLFPAIATHNMTNVYRISVTLQESIDKAVLQQALDELLPVFDTFRVRLRKGIFWNYFETNQLSPPIVEMEQAYPCSYIEPYTNNGYLFRVSYYRDRINLEVFHVLADGMGGVNFLRELTYRYLQLRHPELADRTSVGLSDETSLNTEDSYLKNYRQGRAKGYKTARAVEVRGEKLPGGAMGVLHGYLALPEIKRVCKERQISINEYLTSLLIYSIYREYLHESISSRPVAVAVPVNLRPYFDSMTTRNFFVMVSAVFRPDREERYTREEVQDIVVSSLREQINREHLEDLFSYNVSNQKNIILRSVPMFIKILAMRYVYRSSARANTTTLTNIGSFSIASEYQPYVKRFHGMIAMSTGQNIKGLVCSFGDELVLNFTSTLRDVSIQRRVFRQLAEDGIPVTVESNGVYYE